MRAPTPAARAALDERVEDNDRLELIAEVRALRAILTAVRECEEGDGRCRLCPHCVTRLYVVARPAPVIVPKRYTESPWRRP